jgi:hypothetical protein
MFSRALNVCSAAFALFCRSLFDARALVVFFSGSASIKNEL